MTDRELQLKAVAPRRARPGQPEGLGEISRGLRSIATTPPVRVGRLSTTPEGSQNRMRVYILAPLQGAIVFGASYRGCRSAQPPANFFHGFAVSRAASVLPKRAEFGGIVTFEGFGNCGEFAIIKTPAAVLIPSNSTGLEMTTSVVARH